MSLCQPRVRGASGESSRAAVRYTPTHASWLNQIEIWFSILAKKSLDGASFTSVLELVAHIDAFIADYNQIPRPFVWAKSEVHQKRLKPCFAGQWFRAPASQGGRRFSHTSTLKPDVQCRLEQLSIADAP